MRASERAMRDLLDAADRRGWSVLDPMGTNGVDGLVVGTHEYVHDVIGQMQAQDEFNRPDWRSSRAEAPKSPNGEIAPEVTPSESPSEAIQEDPILARESEHPHGYPAGLAGKVVGRILGAVDGKPVGIVGREAAPEEPSVKCEPSIIEGREEAP